MAFTQEEIQRMRKSSSRIRSRKDLKKVSEEIASEIGKSPVGVRLYLSRYINRKKAGFESNASSASEAKIKRQMEKAQKKIEIKETQGLLAKLQETTQMVRSLEMERDALAARLNTMQEQRRDTLQRILERVGPIDGLLSLNGPDEDSALSERSVSEAR